MKLLRNNSVLSMGGQVSFLLANFALFFLLVNQFDQDSFGTWALFMTLVSITDSLRQGLIHNGLTRLVIQNKAKRGTIQSTGLLMNFGIVILISSFVFFGRDTIAQLWNAPALSSLLVHFVKSVSGLAILQFLNTLCIAREDFKAYITINFLYAVSLIGTVLILSGMVELTLATITTIQLTSIILPILFYFFRFGRSFAAPAFNWAKELWSYGKYVAGTNVLSLLFHKADIILIGYFLDPIHVAVFHFATKIINYCDIPLNALSQVIFPRLAQVNIDQKPNRINKLYVESVSNLFALALTISVVVFFLRDFIINILSSGTYTESSALIGILLIGCIVKPWGRVFGLTLDAVGKPNINFQMLAFSVVINLVANLILIPEYGAVGAAAATSFSIILTIIIGQLRIQKIFGIRQQSVFQQIYADWMLWIKILTQKLKKSWY